MSDYDFNYNAGISASFQGQLSSGYTNWVQSEVSANADFIAYTLFADNTLTLEQATSLRTALQEGHFTVSDLFLAAQSKVGEVNPDGTPKPVLNVDGYGPIDLSQFMGGGEVESWQSGSGKTLVTHSREFLGTFTDATAKDGWDEPNHAPEQTPITESLSETLSQYDGDHKITNLGSDIVTIDLLKGATDSDGDTLSLVNPINESSLPSWMTLDNDGHTLIIDQNARALDSVLDGKHADGAPFVLNYQLTDGQEVVNTSATIDLTGTLDQYEAHIAGQDSATFAKSGGNLNDQTLTVDLPVVQDDAFDFSFSGKLTATETGLTDNQQSTVSDGIIDDGFNAINLGKNGNDFIVTESINLDNAALADHEVDFNVSWNKADATDTTTVTLDWQADYWFNA